MADDIDLPNLVSRLAVNLDGISGAIADASRQGSSMGAALGAGIQRELRDLTSRLPAIQIDGNSSDLDRDLARVRREMAELSNQRIGVDISIEEALRRVNELQPHIQRLSDQHPDINVRATTRQAAAQLDSLLAAARRVDGTDVDINVNVDEDRLGRVHGLLGRLGGALGSLGGLGASLGRTAAGLGAIVPAAASVVTTLANVAPAAGVAVTGMAAVQLASGAVKLAAVGMDDALSAALDPSKAEDYAEALKKLSPEARKFAAAVHDAAPALHQLQQDVQDEVFKGLGDQLKRTGTSVLPVLRTNLKSAGGALNEMAKGALEAGKDLADSGTLGRALGSASKGLHNLAGIPKVVVTALGQIGAAAGPSFERLTKGADGLAKKIGDRLGKAFESGAMEDAIEDAIDLLGQLADVAGNVFSIVGSVFSAAQTSGGGLIGTLQQITGALAEAFATPEVQEGLQALFETMSTLATTAAPLLGEALGLIAPVLAELGPPVQELIIALGEALQPILEQLGPVLVELAGVVGQVIIAALPLLDLIGQLIAALLPALVPLLQAVSDLIAALSPIVAIVAEGLTKLLTPAFKGLADFLVKVVAPAISVVADLLRGDFASASETSRVLIQKMIDFHVNAFRSLPSRISGYVAQFVSVMISGIGDAKNWTVRTIQDMIDQAVSTVRSLPSRAASAVGSMRGVLVNAGVSLVQGFIDGIRSAIPSVQGVLGALTNSLPNWKGPKQKDAKILTPAGRLLILGFIRGIDGTTAQLRAKLASITKALPANVRSGIGKTLAHSTRELERLVTSRDKVVKKLAAAEKRLSDLTKARNKAASDIRAGILREANITTGHSDVNSVKAITVELQQSLKATQRFQANISRLKKMGLRSDLLQQIADAGVEGGAATAEALAKATPAELKKINDLQGKLNKSATDTGKTVGDALYGAGIKAAQGLVNGLKSQQKRIEQIMESIAERMLKAVKKKHKTHSPSRAFHELGVMDMEGLRGGVLATAHRVVGAVTDVASRALNAAGGVGAALSATPTGGQLAAVYGGPGGGGDQTNHFHLYGGDATPDGILRALSWQALVGRG
ncbi:hypothetical protein JK361_22540 [Streptomyces sp. 5-8]|uniref:Phage tail protein n=1 Tax=Streptomyces musisoli TaxID=2802280 RepID=A0ABS1P4Q4_9ACTN|nr:hypothetical protein [Streptomyces musisoli]MBL1107348.1 hypothetical protein [Streptomyces musisoli]